MAPLLACIVALAALCGGTARAARIDPVGTWGCVVYGHPDLGDQRVLFHFAANGGARIARVDDEKTGPWSALTGWFLDGAQLEFSDPQTGRQFNADLRRTTLGGSWRTFANIGGWWCSALDSATTPPQIAAQQQPLPPLIPVLTAIPYYPVQAIRQAKQGQAVTCFFVNSEGVIQKPELIELSDELFREPVLVALERSRYKGWDDAATVRPGCRTYTFKLDQIVNLAVED
jgi:hypothetical protein